MSELIVIGYDDPAAGEQAYRTVLGLQNDMIVQLQGVALVSKDADGKTHVQQPGSIVGGSAAMGLFFGALLGILFMVPILGLAFGGLMGALMGGITKSGVDSQFRAQVQQMLKPGTSALVIYAAKITEDKFADAMKAHGGTVLKTSLSDEDERELAHELGEGTPPAGS